MHQAKPHEKRTRTAVSQVGERLWEVYQAFAQRDLSDYEVSYLFIDGIAERLEFQA
jgi:transposase-like protein